MQTELKFQAILSTTILPSDGVYRRQEVEFSESVLHAMKGTPHYVGHPATKALLEELGATPVEGRFTELKPGESFLAVPLANNPRGGEGAREGTPYNVAVDSLSGLKAVIITRLQEQPETVPVHREFLVRAAGTQGQLASAVGMDIGDYILDAYIEAVLKNEVEDARLLALIMGSKNDRFTLQGRNLRDGKPFYHFRNAQEQGYCTLEEALEVINNK